MRNELIDEWVRDSLARDKPGLKHNQGYTSLEKMREECPPKIWAEHLKLKREAQK